jgi:hypothetical protein
MPGTTVRVRHTRCGPRRKYKTYLAVRAMVMGSPSPERLDIGNEGIKATTEGAALLVKINASPCELAHS